MAKHKRLKKATFGSEGQSMKKVYCTYCRSEIKQGGEYYISRETNQIYCSKDCLASKEAIHGALGDDEDILYLYGEDEQ